MIELVFFLEERSAREMLQGLLPKIIPNSITPRFIVFEGKQDLERQLQRKLQHYRNPYARFIILRDQDAGECKAVKTRLNVICTSTRREHYLIRIVCHALETFYLADLNAVEQGLQKSNLSSKQNQRHYRSPDDQLNPDHLLKQLVPDYQKISGSRSIGPFLDPTNQRSKSFKNLVNGIRKILELPIPTPLFPEGM